MPWVSAARVVDTVQSTLHSSWLLGISLPSGWYHTHEGGVGSRVSPVCHRASLFPPGSVMLPQKMPSPANRIDLASHHAWIVCRVSVEGVPWASVADFKSKLFETLDKQVRPVMILELNV